MMHHIKEIDNLLENFKLDMWWLSAEMHQAKRAFELFGLRVAAALNPMNRYRWPGKWKRHE